MTNPKTPEDSTSQATKTDMTDMWQILHTLSGALRMATQLVVMMIFVPIIVHYVGEEQYGVWTLAISVAAILGFLEFGLVQSTNRFLHAVDAKNDPLRMKEWTCTTFWLTAFAGGVVLAIGIPFAVPIASWLGVPQGMQALTGFVIIAFIWRLAISIPMRNFNAILISQRRMARAHLTQSVMAVVYFASGVYILSEGHGLKGVAIAYLATLIIEHFVYLVMALSITPLSTFLPRYFNPAIVPSIFEFALFAWIGQIVNLAFMRAGVLFVQIASGLVATGGYGIAVRLSSISSDLAAQVIYAGGPQTAKLAAEGGESRKQAGLLTISLTRRAMLFSGALASVALPLGYIFLYGWVGETLAETAKLPLALMALHIFLNTPAMTSSNALSLSGDHRWANLASLTIVAVFIPLAYFGGQLAGGAGVAAAGVLVGTSISLPIFTIRLSKKMGFEMKAFYTDVFRCHAVPFLASFLLAYFLGMLIEAAVPAGRLWMATAGGAGVLCGVVYLTIYFRFFAPEGEKSVMGKIAKPVGFVLSKFSKRAKRK